MSSDIEDFDEYLPDACAEHFFPPSAQDDALSFAVAADLNHLVPELGPEDDDVHDSNAASSSGPSVGGSNLPSSALSPAAPTPEPWELHGSYSDWKTT